MFILVIDDCFCMTFRTLNAVVSMYKLRHLIIFVRDNIILGRVQSAQLRL